MSTTEQAETECPHEAVFTDGRVPCTLPRHPRDEPHSYGEILIPFDDEGPTP